MGSDLLAFSVALEFHHQSINDVASCSFVSHMSHVCRVKELGEGSSVAEVNYDVQPLPRELPDFASCFSVIKKHVASLLLWGTILYVKQNVTLMACTLA